MKWKDVSTFSRYDNVREPHAWELEGCIFRVLVHKHIDDPSTYFVSANDIGLQRTSLGTLEKDLAKQRAIGFVKNHFAIMSKSFRQAIEPEPAHDPKPKKAAFKKRKSARVR